MSIGVRRSPLRRDAEHELEKALDAMHAGKNDRVLARKVFSDLLEGPNRPTLKGAVKKALKAVDDARTTSPDTPARQA